LRTIWAEADPVMRELGRPTVERAVQSARASIEHGRSPLEVIGDDQIACREPFLQLTRQALEDGTLLLTPSYVAGSGHGHIATARPRSASRAISSCSATRRACSS
jgi:hypothetical protein